NGYRNLALVVVIAMVSLFSRSASAQSRIAESIQSAQRVVVKGSSPNHLIAMSKDNGRLSSSKKLGRMVLLLAPTEAQEKAAADLIAAQHDASSPLFHQWLTPAEFSQRFGIVDTDASQVRQWLEGQGLTVHQVSQSHRFIVFS